MEKQQERALLIGLNITTNVKKLDDIDINESMEELKELTKAAGAEVVGNLIQNRPAIDAAYYVGKGKVEEDRKSTRLNSSHIGSSRMPSSA